MGIKSYYHYLGPLVFIYHNNVFISIILFISNYYTYNFTPKVFPYLQLFPFIIGNLNSVSIGPFHNDVSTSVRHTYIWTCAVASGYCALTTDGSGHIFLNFFTSLFVCTPRSLKGSSLGWDTPLTLYVDYAGLAHHSSGRGLGGHTCPRPPRVFWRFCRHYLMYLGAHWYKTLHQGSPSAGYHALPVSNGSLSQWSYRSPL